jgi:hypothetical protein
MQRFQLVSKFHGEANGVLQADPSHLQELVAKEISDGNSVTVFDRDTGGIFPVNEPEDIDDLPDAINGFAAAKVASVVQRIHVQ